jgi:hypothetical protein
MPDTAEWRGRTLPSPRTTGQRSTASERRYGGLPGVISEVRALRIRVIAFSAVFLV